MDGQAARNHDFNPRSPCGERPPQHSGDRAAGRFQSTLPVWGATGASDISVIQIHEFQSTLPVWGATDYPSAQKAKRTYFNPRSPCGERLSAFLIAVLPLLFQSTLPVWGATAGPVFHENSSIFQSTLPVWGATRRRRHLSPIPPISIHAPRVGSDSKDA